VVSGIQVRAVHEHVREPHVQTNRWSRICLQESDRTQSERKCFVKKGGCQVSQAADVEIQKESIFEDDAVSFLPYGVATFENDEQNVWGCQVSKSTTCEFCFDTHHIEEEMLAMPSQYVI
jgi:hypothetical protein